MKRQSLGFTLIELLVALGVAAILAALAIPAFNNFIMNNRDANQINSLALSFNYARSEAVKLNTPVGVQVCPSSDQTTCNGPANGWSAGWVVLDMSTTPNPRVIQGVPALAGTNTITAAGAGANGVTFKSNGTVVGSAQIKICDQRGGAYARDVEISAVGSISSSQMAGQSATGAALACP
ncbi:MAG TPA: GspH/FimT family protein [Steroidobacteraceae bacterium]|jgi:type IV fimbrial biogenesis protein FimT